eukprot:CAMPEP_0168722536 /NCGR_PEP_ID=MMETSP0724-20121128/2648_1 /TAXON_ID=265536 /ORGANISM="Amphiprora sp., Strain CCMP467" /LENGTH=431 /DNA_ID=CAMNT_0008769211 /DNA_START=1 /DNA_END=1296 /DNA_ORIENTATION=+
MANNNNNSNTNIPLVCRDGRFRAGRALMTSSSSSNGNNNSNKEKAIDLFGNLLEQVRQSYGDDHVECCAAYYEYGNALLRNVQQQNEEHQDEEEEEEQQPTQDPSLSSSSDKRAAAARAAERRLQSSTSAETLKEMSQNPSDLSKKPAAAAATAGTKVQSEPPHEDEEDPNDNSDEANNEKDEEENDDDEDEEEDTDLLLALEMMDTAWCILDLYMNGDGNNNNNNNNKTYREWGNESLARFSTGIGDTLSALGRHADAAGAYLQALEHRQKELRRYKNSNNDHPKDSVSLADLTRHRKIVETLILLTEELLACPAGHDVVTETKAVICKAADRISLAQSYYEQTQQAQQETVLLMAQAAAKGAGEKDSKIAKKKEWEQEKENVCFASTLVMGVGLQLAALDGGEPPNTSSSQNGEEEDSKPPATKKAKKG